MTLARFALAILVCAPSMVSAQPVETEIPGVTAELIELRQHEGVLRLAVRLMNTAAGETPSGTSIKFSEVTLIDLKDNKKHSAIRDPKGQFLAEPRSDTDDGGRWWVQIPPKAEAILWLLFEPLPAESVVSVQIPHMFPFENVTVTEGPSKVFSPTGAESTPGGYMARLVSAVRTKTGEVRLRLRIERTGAVFEGPALVYAEAALIEPAEKKMHYVLRDTNGMVVAQPITDEGDGGRFWLHTMKPGGVALMSLTFTGPPGAVETVDLLLPQFLPMPGIKIVNETEQGKR